MPPRSDGCNVRDGVGELLCGRRRRGGGGICIGVSISFVRRDGLLDLPRHGLALAEHEARVPVLREQDGDEVRGQKPLRRGCQGAVVAKLVSALGYEAGQSVITEDQQECVTVGELDLQVERRALITARTRTGSRVKSVGGGRGWGRRGQREGGGEHVEGDKRPITAGASVWEGVEPIVGK